MANKVLISQNSLVQAYAPQTFPGTHSMRVIQFNPMVGTGFTGAIVIEGSYAASPSNNDYTPIMSVTFTNHTQNLSLEVEASHPYLRARITTSIQGAIAVFADSASRAIQGSQGASPATALIDSPNRVSGSGNSFKINSVVVPAITSDDVVYANNFALTVTDVLDGRNGAVGKQDKIGTGVITALDSDVNVLTGAAAAGLTPADMQKLADVTVSAADLNRLAGSTGNIQSQIDSITSSIPTDFGSLEVPSSSLNSFFNQVPTVNTSTLNQLTGLTAASADINPLTGAAGRYTLADIVKLGQVQASATELNKLVGFSGGAADLNRIVGLATSPADLNSIAGIAGSGVTSAQLQHLAGLSTNVQAALAALPNLSGLVASADDLNTLAGIFVGTSGYPAQISKTEIGYLDGLTGNLQTQLNNKRNTNTPIGIGEIQNVSITTTELNYLQGSTSNIQAQLNAILSNSITNAGGSLTAPLYLANGTATAPSLAFVAPATNSGLYRFGSNGVGITVGGTRFASFDGTFAVFGDGLATGGATVRGNSPSLSSPTYSFTGDTDTGIFRSGSDSLSIVAGSEDMARFDAANNIVSIGGNVASNNQVNITGVFAGEKVLGTAIVRAGSVSGTTGVTNLYTVPAGRMAIVTKIMVVLTQVTGFTNGALLRMNMGINAPSYDEIVDNINSPNIYNPGTYQFDTANQILVLGQGDNVFTAIAGSSGADYQALTPGAILRANVSTLAGADTYNMQIIVMGVETASA